MWLILTTVCGISSVFQDIFSKKSLISKRYSDWTIIFVRFLYVLPSLLVIWLFVGTSVKIAKPLHFFAVIFVLVSIEIAGQYLYHQSIKFGSLSLVKPFSSTTPVLIIPMAYLLRGELPNFYGMAGVLCIAASLAILIIEQAKRRPNTQPKQDNTSNRTGILFMLGAAALWSITSTLQKTGPELLEGGTLIARIIFFGFWYLGGVAAVLFVYHALWIKIPMSDFFRKENRRFLIPIGIFASLSSVTQYWAMALTHPAYVNAMKRAFAALHLEFDRRFFQERISFWRIVGNGVNLVGILFLLLGMLQ